MTADLAQLEQSVAHDWAYLVQRRFDVTGTFAQARARLPLEADGATFRAALEEIVAKMGEGHGFVLLPCEKRKLRRWPFSVVDTADGLIVDNVEGTAQIEVGDRLVAIDGVPVATMIVRAEQRAAASSDRSRRAVALARLAVTSADHLRVRIHDNDGHSRTLDLATKTWIPRLPTDIIETRDLGNHVSYLRISSFFPVDWQDWLTAKDEARRQQLLAPAHRQIEDAFDAVNGSRALILDLRGNTGGTDLMGQMVTDHLLPSGYVFYSLSSRTVDGHWSFPNPWTPRSGATLYAGRVVVLIDERTASTSDNVTRSLRDNRPDIVFIGRPTAGTSGAPRPVTLSNSGASVQFCTMRVYGPKGAPIEGHPVEPDIRRPKRRIDVVRHVDTDLAAALDTLGWRPPQ